MSSTDDDLKERIERLQNDPRFAALNTRIRTLPLWFASGATLSALATHLYVLPRLRHPLRAPRWVVYAMGGMIGGMVGGQAGIWSLRRYLRREDPNGEILALGKEIMEGRKGAACPLPGTTSTVKTTEQGQSLDAPPKVATKEPKRNKYGDVIEE
jgi:hypothetical protein